MNKEVNFKPLNTKVLLEQIREEQKTSSGIILSTTETVEDKAKVVAIGSLVKDLEVGDVVMFDSKRAVEVTIEDKSFLLSDYDYIIGIYQ